MPAAFCEDERLDATSCVSTAEAKTDELCKQLSQTQALLAEAGKKAAEAEDKAADFQSQISDFGFQLDMLAYARIR